MMPILHFTADWKQIPNTIQAMIDFRAWVDEETFVSRAVGADRLDIEAQVEFPGVYDGIVRDRYLEKIISGKIPPTGSPRDHITFLAPAHRTWCEKWTRPKF